MSNDSKIRTEKDITERTIVKVREYTQFLCETAVENYKITCKYSPSMVANASFYFARKCCNLKNIWGRDLEEYTGYTQQGLIDII